MSLPCSSRVYKLELIPKWIKEFIESEPKFKFDRCHFAGYGESSLDFELVFFVLDPDFNLYMDLQQEFFLALFKKFNDEGIEFAFPTQTLYIEKVAMPAPAGPVESRQITSLSQA